MPTKSTMRVPRRIRRFALYRVALTVTLIAVIGAVVQRLTLVYAATRQAQIADQSPQPTPSSPSTLPRGKKLILKDGSFQLIREYQLNGDRVRYYSIDSGQWEEIPANLVDWDATKKVEAEESSRDSAYIEKVDEQEKRIHAEMQLDIDASVEAAPGVFLPPGEGLFIFDGKAVLPVGQTQTNTNLSKKQLLKQVLVPVPIVPSRQTISLPGAHSKTRLTIAQPEFYMRTADLRDPVLELIRAKVHGDSRQMENLEELFGQQRATRDTIATQKWQIAKGVYRFTLSKPLVPGEYALAEIVQSESPSVYVWDFGLGGSAEPSVSKPH